MESDAAAPPEALPGGQRMGELGRYLLGRALRRTRLELAGAVWSAGAEALGTIEWASFASANPLPLVWPAADRQFFRRCAQRRNFRCRLRPPARFSNPPFGYRFWPAIFCAVNNKTFRSFSFVLLSSRRN